MNRTLLGKPEELASRRIPRLREDDKAPGNRPRDPSTLLYPLGKDTRVVAPNKPLSLTGFRMDDRPGVEKVFVILSATELGLARYFDHDGKQVTAPSAAGDLLNSLNAELVTMFENSDAVASRGITRVPQRVGVLRDGVKPGMVEVTLTHQPR